MSESKADAFAAIAAMDPEEENAARLALLEQAAPAPFAGPDLPMEPAGEGGFCPATAPMRDRAALDAAVEEARRAHAPFLRDFAPPLESTRACHELREFDWRLLPDERWERVSLPHYGGPIGRAAAEYRTTFEPPAPVLAHEAQFLRFTGVDYRAHVFLNGAFVGSHEGFFAPFEFVVTGRLRAGKNDLLVMVENDAITRGNQAWDQDAEGEKLYAATFLGWDEPGMAWHHCPPGMGIWGKVTLEGRAATQIGDLFVRPLVGEERAELWIEVFHSLPEYAEGLRLRYSICGQNFEEILCKDREVDPGVRLGPNRNLFKYTVAIPGARLWSPEAPWLYQLQVELLRGGQVIDAASSQFGMRSFLIDESTDPKGKFFLNGKEIRLRGANTMGFEQLAALRGEWDRLIDDILLTKVCGMNFWRVTQRPVQEEIYSLCDRLGLMVQSDLPHFGTIRLTQFAESVRQSEEMERLLRRHPSSVLVSFINEPFPEAWHRKPHRFLARADMENLFEACTHAVRLHNPDRQVKPIDGDYDPPGPGIADIHCYNGWYRWDRLPLGALNKGLWHATKPGWTTGCGEFGAEGLDDADLIRRRCPAAWLVPDPVHGWNPGLIAQSQTGRHQPMWFEAPAAGGAAPVGEWVRASQEFQAWIVRLMTEAFRRDDRMVTFAIHLFIDAWPTGWMKAIMDCERNPKLAFFACRDALRPLLVTLRMDRWAAFSGEDIEAEVHLSNDTHETPDLQLSYQAEGGAGPLCGGKMTTTPASMANKPIGKLRWPAPDVATRTGYKLRATAATPGGGPLSESVWDVSVFPRPCGPPPSVAAWDGVLPRWAQKTGATVSPSSRTILVCGNHLRERGGEAMGDLVRLAGDGATVILSVLPEGRYEIAGGSIEIVPCSNGPRYAACRNTGHPLVDGFEANDFRFWLDDETGYPTPFLETTFVAADWIPIVKTATGAPKPDVMQSSPDLFFIPSHAVAEKLTGRGRLVICQIELDRYVTSNPVARIFAERLLR